MQINYTPSKTCAAWMRDLSFVRWLIGPLGSGKSSAAIHELFRRSVGQAPDDQGRRRTRFAIVRNTLAQMRTTVLPDIQAYLGTLVNWKVSQSTVYIDFKLEDGTRVVSEWLMIPLENPEDVRRLLSTQLTGVWFEEFREIDPAFVQPALGRIGRYPSMGIRPTWQGMIGTSNPYADGSEWHRMLEQELPAGWGVYRQPSGLSPDAENAENLPDGYYERLCEGASDNFIRVSVHGLNGPDLSGAPVFGDSFSFDFHTRPHVSVIEGKSFALGMDTDRNPACLIAQRGHAGELRVYKEVFAEGKGIENFVSQDLVPAMYEGFRGMAHVIIDPSAVRKSSISEENQVEAMQRMGFDVALAPTNKIEPRLRAVDNLLTTQIQGHPALLIDRNGCPTLIKALMSAYKYPRSASGQLSPSPEKLHPWSDLADALMYLALGFTASRMGRPVGVRTRGAVRPPSRTVASAGWT